MNCMQNDEGYKNARQLAEALAAAAQRVKEGVMLTEEQKSTLKEAIEEIREFWERIKSLFFPDFDNLTDSLREIYKMMAFCEQEKRRLRFFGCGKRDIFKKRVHIKRAIFQKPKYRKWRISVYGFYG